MSIVKVVMPQMGESITEGTIAKWHKKKGDKVLKDETLLEISTDKVDSEIPAPVSGTLVNILVEEQKTVPVQTIIAEIETESSAVTVDSVPTVTQEKEDNSVGTKKVSNETLELVSTLAVSEQKKGSRFYSPLVLNIAQQENVSMAELEKIPGSGTEGRVTKNDILSYIKKRQSEPVISMSPTEIKPTEHQAVSIDVSPASKGKIVDDATLAAKYPAPQHEILQMSNIVQKMGMHMSASWNTSPHVFAISEADMTKIVKYRKQHGADFEKREGFKLTYTHFIVSATIRALKDFPLVNSSIEGDKIILKKFINLGVAVAADNGLIVPVIKNAEEKNFLGLARAVNELAQKTRAKKLMPDDVSGGSFTITNYGVFGNIIGTPIINPPQVAILGVGALQKRPVVVDDAVAIRTMTYLTLSFDHRIIDGALGGMFVQRVTKYLEEYDFAAI